MPCIPTYNIYNGIGYVSIHLKPFCYNTFCLEKVNTIVVINRKCEEMNLKNLIYYNLYYNRL